MVAATDLIGVVVLLFIAVVALIVLFFDALSRVLVGAVAALARAPWRGGQVRRQADGGGGDRPEWGREHSRRS